MLQKSIIPLILLLVISAAAYLGLGYFTERSQFWQVIWLFTLAFGAYLKLGQSQYSLKILLFTAVAARLLFLFSWPALSDDYYRFIWDGRLLVAGHNPFAQLPSYYLPVLSQIPGLNPELYQHLNSPQYYSVYPPVCQYVFALSAWLSWESNRGMLIIMRLFLITAEVGNIYFLIKLLHHYNKPIRHVVWYALNPLVIMELTGNLHFEALVLFFLLGSLYLITQKKIIFAGILFALGRWRKIVAFAGNAHFTGPFRLAQVYMV